MFKDVSFSRLRVFCEVVDSQGFRTASEHLDMSQPAISAHIRALEKDLQTQLLERGRFTKVTDAGAILYDYAKQTLQKSEEISREIAELRQANVGRIAVASGVTIARHTMPQVFSVFKRENPRIEMILRIGNQKQICEMTLSREVDFGFTVGKFPFAGLVSKTVAKEEVVFVVGPRHPLAKRETVNPAELSNYQFIVPAPNVTYTTIVQQALDFYNVTVKDTLMIIEDTECMKRIVSTGLGISVLLKTGVIDEIRAGKLVMLNLTAEPFYDDIRIVTRADKHFSPIQNKFIKFCSQTIQSQLANNIVR